MTARSRWRSFWLVFSGVGCIRFIRSEWRVWQDEQAAPCFQLAALADAPADLPPYPLDFAPLLALPFGKLDEGGVPSNAPFGRYPAVYHPTTIAQYALACWNAYLATGEADHRERFLVQARWLVAHERRLGGDAGGWPIPFAPHDYAAPADWLSALTQGNAISVLVRAYRLTGEQSFLQTARRAVRTFERDISEGGVCAALGEDGLFFEEVAVYPAAHILNGFLLALFGLSDYVALTHDRVVTVLVERSLATLHTLLDAFDAGYWTRYDLLHRRLVPRFYHALHVTLLEALARQSGCAHCAALAERWAGYQRRFSCRLRYVVVSRLARYRRAVLRRVRQRLFPMPAAAGQPGPERVCVPITAFPVAGGMRGVLAGVAQTMADEWQMDYLAGQVGAQAEGLAIQPFGGALANPWQFPNLWLYALAGGRKLFTLLRQGAGYRLILPQDGVCTGAFAALVGKLAGARVVCMDHGAVTLSYSHTFRAERRQSLQGQALPLRWLSRLRLLGYWPSLRLLGWLTTRCADQLLVAGDEVEEVYRERLGVHPSRIIRYPYVLDAARYRRPDAANRAALRAELALPADGVVVTMINRLAPEKGLDVAVAGMRQALELLPVALRARVRFIIAGDGPLRCAVEAERDRAGLRDCCLLWGEVNPDEVVRLLHASDIFLYAGTRGTNYSMAVLEAMAAGCAVIASTEPRSNAALLADGRGLAIPVRDAAAVAEALRQVMADAPLRRRMGDLASAYVAEHHSGAALKQRLRSAAFWAAPAPAAAQVEGQKTPVGRKE